jgi:hypothetical protein
MFTGPNTITNGLVLSLDAANAKSYVSGSTTWRDLSGNNNSGSLVNGPTFSSANGGSIVFDGVDDFVNIGNQSSLGFTNGIFTVDTWIYIPSSWTAGSQYPNLISKGATAGWDTDGWSLFVFRDYPNPSIYSWGCGMRNGGSNNVFARNGCSTNTYLNIVMVLNGSGTTIRLYENGSQIATGTQTINPASNSTNVLIARDNNIQSFPGRVATIKIYNRALSASEIAQNYDAQKSRFGL